MWRNTYKDYRPDKEWIQDPVEPGRGIIGCEMHELNGWGEEQHQKRPKKPGWIKNFLNALFRQNT